MKSLELQINYSDFNILFFFIQGQLDQQTNSSNNFSNTGAYSLFNPNSWNPNLPAHIKTPRTTHENFNPVQHHSLFAGQGPQSLAQLLEQQNQWQKNDS